MKKYTIIATMFALTLAACSTTQNSNSTSSSASSRSTPVAKLGTITNKETIVSQNTSRGNPLPIDIGVGLGGGGSVGWGVGLGLGQLIGGLLSHTSTTTSTDYQYNIKLNSTETLTLRSQQDFAVGSCLTVWTLEGNNSYPKIEANPSCQLAPVVQN